MDHRWGRAILSSLPGLYFTHGWMHPNPRMNPWASICRLSEAPKPWGILGQVHPGLHHLHPGLHHFHPGTRQPHPGFVQPESGRVQIGPGSVRVGLWIWADLPWVGACQTLGHCKCSVVRCVPWPGLLQIQSGLLQIQSGSVQIRSGAPPSVPWAYLLGLVARFIHDEGRAVGWPPLPGGAARIAHDIIPGRGLG
jgi:hypothetical protein